MFNATQLKSTDPRLAPAQFLKPTGKPAWPFRPRTSQLPVTQADNLFFPSAGTQVFAPVHGDSRHRNRSAAWDVARGARFWAVQSSAASSVVGPVLPYAYSFLYSHRYSRGLFQRASYLFDIPGCL